MKLEEENKKPKIAIKKLSDLQDFNNFSADFHANLSNSIDAFKKIGLDDIIKLLEPKIHLLKNIIKLSDFNKKDLEFSIPTRNKNIIIDVIFGNKDIDQIKKGVGKLRVSNEDFNQIIVGIYHIVNDFNIKGKIIEEKLLLLDRLKELEELEKNFN